MGAGNLAVACLWLLLGQVPSDVFYTNQRSHRIDVNFKADQRAEIREVRLYASSDPDHKNWVQVGSIAPQADHFVFHAKGDGAYWLRVASINGQGKQTPENIAAGPPDQKMVIDSQKPIIRTLQATRQGKEVAVNWEMQEENPDANSFRLEYQPKDSGAGPWTAIRATPGPLGQARFELTSGKASVVRLVMRDLAGNLSFALAEVPAETVTPASYNPMTGATGAAQAVGTTTVPAGPPVLPKGVAIPSPAPMFPVPAAPVAALPVGLPAPVTPAPVVPEPAGLPGTADANPFAAKSSPAPLANRLPGPVASPPPAIAPIAPLQEPSSLPGVTPIVATSTGPELKVVASSKWTPPPPKVAPPVAPAPAAPAAVPTPAALPRNSVAKGPIRQLPLLQYINQPEFVIEYEVSKIGPSGVGSVDLYRTQDDGKTWEKYAEDQKIGGMEKGTHLQRLLKLDGEADGVFGFILVIKNRAKVGRNPPRPGDVPELRIELDTVRPVAELFEPTPDVQPGRLLLRWKAFDKNLTPAPINLEWAEKRDGEWHPIGLNLPNREHFSWKLPDELPVEVFLRLRVRDLAGNETIAITPTALPVDLHEPEGHLLKVSVPGY